MTAASVLVLGATGYVGGRLVPELLRRGHGVRCLTRSPDRLESLAWVCEHRESDSTAALEIVEGDLDDRSSLDEAFAGIDQVVYLVHSLGDDDFEEREAAAAANTRAASDDAGVEHIVYLSGLGDESADLSPHLRSRHAVGAELASGAASVTELRAAVVLGAGSASFEMMRSLVDVLPVMLAPRWVSRTELQPIAIVDVLTYLIAALEHGGSEHTESGDVESGVSDPGDERDGRHHRIVEIGGPDRMTYAQMMQRYASVAGIRRLIIPVPVLSLGLSSHWVNVVTPLPRGLAASLIESLAHDVVVTDDSAAELSAHEPISVDRAIESALSAVQELDIPTRWSGFSERERSARPRPWDPDWSGGTVYEDVRRLTVDVSSEQFQRTVRGIGGDRGWYSFGGLWAIRGVADKLVGGVGLRRGRRHPDEITVGEALDFWRVDALRDDLFRLRAEMRLPGEAWLEWQTSRNEHGATEVVQRARYVPTGLLGRLYWWLVVPFHAAIFPIMLRRIAAAAESAAASASRPAA